jgi:hypothetical protein
VFKRSQPSQPQQDDAKAAEYISRVAPAALALDQDHIRFPSAVLLPITARAAGLPGASERPWSRMSYSVFYGGTPTMYSISLRRELADAMKSSIRARRTLSEGLLMALATKTGRRPSMAETSQNQNMDQAESLLALGKPIFRATILAALFSEPDNYDQAERARKLMETALRARGMQAQRLIYVAERALHYLQPGGNLFPEMDEPIVFPEEALPLLPPPTRQVFPADDSVFIGTHSIEGRDVYFSTTKGLDPTLPPPPHAINLLLGEMGSGKTTLVRWMMLQRLLQGRTVLSIDPEGENNSLCEALGGKVVPAGIPADKDTCLLHPLQADNPSDMLLAVRFIMTILAGESAMTPGVNAVLHEAVLSRWERFPGNMGIADLRDAIATVNSPDIAIPLAILKEYQNGGVNDGFFDRKNALLSTRLEPAQWYNFDLSTLREANKKIVHAVLAWFIYHVVTVGKQPMDIYIDEGWRLLRSGAFADLLDELGRRARKRGIGVSLVTHLPGDLAKNQTSLSMASTAFIGRMSPDEAKIFFRSLGVPESEAAANAERASLLPPRVFLAAPSGGRGALFPVNVTIPPVWIDFWKRLGATTFVRPQQ